MDERLAFLSCHFLSVTELFIYSPTFLDCHSYSNNNTKVTSKNEKKDIQI